MRHHYAGGWHDPLRLTGDSRPRWVSWDHLPQCALVIAGLLFATASAEDLDLLTGAIDPLQAGRQRLLFIRAAGADLELDKNEFASDQQAPGGFIRAYDDWNSMLTFDRNKNQMLDWFEAEAYREAIRNSVMKQYDADENRVLSGSERTHALKALLSGKIRPLLQDRPSESVPPGSPSDAANPREELLDEMIGFRVPHQQFDQRALKQRLTKVFDANGDGHLDIEEQNAIGRAQVLREREVTDLNNDGVIDPLEALTAQDAKELNRIEFMIRYGRLQHADQNGPLDPGAMDEAIRRMRQQIAESRKARLERYDRDRDGKLSVEEARAIQADLAKRRANPEVLKRFDRDSNGELDGTERQAFNEAASQMAQRIQKAKIKRYDTDGDGRLSESEQRTADTESIRRFDEDGDGILLLTEQEKLIEFLERE
jgi:Ca2+-binding EF-hand superfamily protein